MNNDSDNAIGLFLVWLEDNGLSEKFDINVSHNPLAMGWPSLFPRNAVSGAFWWANTEEGWNYWDNVDRKWRELYNEMTNEKDLS
jgi:hypothetical protein